VGLYCSKAIAQRRSAKGKLWRAPTVENLINYKSGRQKPEMFNLKKTEIAGNNF
jgi:hypothetical protein